MIITGFSRGITVVGAGNCNVRKQQTYYNQKPHKKQRGITTLLNSVQLTSIPSLSLTENLWRCSGPTMSSVFTDKQSTGTQLNHHYHSSLNTARPHLNLQLYGGHTDISCSARFGAVLHDVSVYSRC